MLLRTALADVPDLWIPDVVAERSGATVLTLEFSAGERVDLYAKLHPEAMPRSMNTLVKLMLQSIFEEGLFHADPHPGNVFVLPDGRLSLLDFGNTGELDEPMRESLILLLEAVVKGDARAATEAYLEMAPASEDVNRTALLAGHQGSALRNPQDRPGGCFHRGCVRFADERRKPERGAQSRRVCVC